MGASFSLPAVLSIAGSDCSGGAGIEADLKTILALGLYGEAAVTSVTAQNTTTVRVCHQVPSDVIEAQVDAVFGDIAPAAVKVGMLGSAEAAHAVAHALRRHGVRIAAANTHGTGCTLSSAIACGLAEGLDLERAVRDAKAYLVGALRAGLDLGAGSGPVDHAWYVRSRLAYPA